MGVRHSKDCAGNAENKFPRAMSKCSETVLRFKFVHASSGQFTVCS